MFLANAPQSTPVKQQDTDPGTARREFADYPNLRLILTSPQSVGNRKTPPSSSSSSSSSGIYFARPVIHSLQSVSDVSSFVTSLQSESWIVFLKMCYLII